MKELGDYKENIRRVAGEAMKGYGEHMERIWRIYGEHTEAIWGGYRKRVGGSGRGGSLCYREVSGVSYQEHTQHIWSRDRAAWTASGGTYGGTPRRYGEDIQRHGDYTHRR